MVVTIVAVLVVAGVVWAQDHFIIMFPEGVTRGGFTDHPHVADRSIIHVSVPIESEDCAGYDRGFFDTGGFAAPANAVGYLTGRQLERFEVDYVVALREAWCSGVRDPTFSTDLGNMWVADPAVLLGRGGRDPREWWDTDGPTTPREVNYPGWCDYLRVHLAIKDRYDASMDPTEWNFVAAQLATCD